MLFAKSHHGAIWFPAKLDTWAFQFRGTKLRQEYRQAKGCLRTIYATKDSTNDFQINFSSVVVSIHATIWCWYSSNETEVTNYLRKPLKLSTVNPQCRNTRLVATIHYRLVILAACSFSSPWVGYSGQLFLIIIINEKVARLVTLLRWWCGHQTVFRNKHSFRNLCSVIRLPSEGLNLEVLPHLYL